MEEEGECEGTIGQADVLMGDGIFLGVKALSGEFIVGTKDGIWKTRTMHRKPYEERWDEEDLGKITGVPWRTSDDDDEVDGEKLPAVERSMNEEGTEAKEETMAQDVIPRALQISKRTW